MDGSLQGLNFLRVEQGSINIATNGSVQDCPSHFEKMPGSRSIAKRNDHTTFRLVLAFKHVGHFPDKRRQVGGDPLRANAPKLCAGCVAGGWHIGV